MHPVQILGLTLAGVGLLLIVLMIIFFAVLPFSGAYILGFLAGIIFFVMGVGLTVAGSGFVAGQELLKDPEVRSQVMGIAM